MHGRGPRRAGRRGAAPQLRSRAKSAFDVFKDEEHAARQELGAHYHLMDCENVQRVSETWREIKSDPDRLRGWHETNA